MTHNLLQERRLHQEEMQKRLKAILKNPANRFCSECPEQKPTWGVLLEPPVEGGMKLGALCCYNCYSYHFRLKSTCTVKSAKMASEWTKEEVSILEKSGNLMVNSIYEALLESTQKEKVDLKTFVENKYQNLHFFSKKIYSAQTTTRDVNRRSSKQSRQRSSSGSKSRRSSSASKPRRSSSRSKPRRSEKSHDDQKREPSGLDKGKRPTLNRSASKRSSRYLLQTMSDHLRHSNSHSCGKQSPPTCNSSGKKDHGKDDPQDRKSRRPSLKTRSRSDRLLALSDHARLSARNLNFGVGEKTNSRRPPSREASTQEDLRVMSDHVKRSASSSAAFNRPQRYSSHERLPVKEKTTRHHRTRSPSHRTRSPTYNLEELRPKRISPGSRHKRHDGDFIPPKPRRSSGLQQEEKGLPLSSLPRQRGRGETQASTGTSFQLHKASSFRLDRLGPSLPKDLDASDEGIGYGLPFYLAGHNSCPSIMEDISDLTSSGLNSSSSGSELDNSSMTGKNTKLNSRKISDERVTGVPGKQSGTAAPSNNTDHHAMDDDQSESSSLADYMKRYRQSRAIMEDDHRHHDGESRGPLPLVSNSRAARGNTQESKLIATSNPVVPLRAALENLETSILGQPFMILPIQPRHSGSGGGPERSFHCYDDHEDSFKRYSARLGSERTAYWQAKLAPLTNRDCCDNGQFLSSDSLSVISEATRSVISEGTRSRSSSGRAQAA